MFLLIMTIPHFATAHLTESLSKIISYIENERGNRRDVQYFSVLKKSFTKLINGGGDILLAQRRSEAHHQETDRNLKEGRVNRQKEGAHRLCWDWTPSPASLLEQAFEILTGSDHQDFTVDASKPL